MDMDGSLFEAVKFMPDGQPALNWALSVYSTNTKAPGWFDVFTVEVETYITTFPNPVVVSTLNLSTSSEGVASINSDTLSPTNNWSVGAYSTMTVSTTSGALITGITSSPYNAGRIILIRNSTASGGLVTFANQNSGSNAANRFDNGSNKVLAPGDGVLAWYSNLDSRWHFIDINRGDDVQLYTTVGNSTWTKPSWASKVTVLAQGAGGGGGSGCKGAAGTLRRGGHGGGGGAYAEKTFRASALTSTVTVSVPDGGAGGISGNSGSGNFGQPGGDATFGTYLKAAGGGGGLGGTASGVDLAYNSTPGLTSDGAAPTVSSTTGAGGISGSNSMLGGSSGGSGGGIKTGNATSNGGVGGGMPAASNNTTAGGAANGGSGSTPITDMAGTGGGGGASGISGGTGGAGGVGSGGGGGGACSTGSSGAGGKGGRGFLIVISS